MSTTVKEIKSHEVIETKNATHFLQSLEIRGYRCFERLRIEKLGRVNLIVGKNNVGKTALLEALSIYANHDKPELLRRIAIGRNESTSETSYDEQGFVLKHLLYKRPDISDRNLPRRASPYFVVSEGGERLEYFVDKFLSVENDTELHNLSFSEAFLEATGSKTTLVMCYFDPSSSSPRAVYFPKSKRDEFGSFLIESGGLTNDQVVRFWDEITLTPAEQKVTDALRILLSDLMRINMIAYPKGSSNRVPLVQVSNQNEPVPLKSFGDGTNRLFGISLALVNCENGFLLVDEIENGIHFSLLPDVWKLIFKTARELNVQVYATTHSFDCIEAFAEAAIADEKSDGMLIRLARKGDDIKAFTFDETQLETITKEGIEVR